jgi:hypothetical protein
VVRIVFICCRGCLLRVSQRAALLASHVETLRQRARAQPYAIASFMERSNNNSLSVEYEHYNIELHPLITAEISPSSASALHPWCILRHPLVIPTLDGFIELCPHTH